MDAYIKGVDRAGITVYYIGKKSANGHPYVSTNPADAYDGFTLDSAKAHAEELNKGTPQHGVTFTATKD